mgnify:FL=1
MGKRLLSAAIAMLWLLSGGIAWADGEADLDLAGAKAAVLMEQGSGQVVYGAQSDEKLEVGGLSRLPALLAVCEGIDEGLLGLDMTVTVSHAAAGIKGPTAFLSAGEVIDAGSLLKAGIMITAGDAIYALGEAVFGTEEACLTRIQERLAGLNIQAEYRDIMGTGVKLSAQDLATLGKALMASPSFTSYSGIFLDTITHPDGRETQLASSNRLIKSMPGCNGVATGSSNTAGYCGVFSVKRNGATWLCAVIGAPDAAARFSTATALLEHGFAAYEVKTLARAESILVDAVPVQGAKQTSVALVAASDAILLLPKGVSFEAKYDLPETLNAPVSSQEAVGRVTYVNGDGETLCRVDLLPAEDILQAQVLDYAAMLLQRWVHS